MQPFPTHVYPLFRRFLGQQRWAFALILLSPLAMALESTIMPYALQLLVDIMTQPLKASPHDLWAVMATPIALYGGAWAVMIIIYRVQEWVGTSAFPRLHAEVRMAAFAHVQAHSHRFFSDRFAGSIANKISDLPRAMGSFIHLACWRLTPAISVTLSVLAMLAWMDPIVALILLVWTCLHVGIGLYYAQPINRLSAQTAEYKSALQGLMVDSFSNQLAVRLFARQSQEMDVLGRAQSTEQASHRAMLRAMCVMRFITDIPMLLAIMALLVLVVWLWQQQVMSVGELVFVMYGSMNVMVYIWMLSVEMPQFYGEIGIIRQALELMQVPHEIVDTPAATPLILHGGRIEFDAVSFGYREQTGIFDALSLRIEAGEKVGLVGFSGSGKTTLINLLLRLYDVQSGAIRIDGQDLREVTQASLHRAIAVIPQETALFHRSLMDNIRYGLPDADDAAVMAAAEKAQSHAFIMGLEQGYATEVGERGVKLSGGQRQRIALARAFLKDAPILIMDEATSALDSMTERVIQDKMQDLMQGKTAIVIAHRLSTLSQLDRILVFDKGRLIEEGAHTALLAQGGHYSTLWNLQAGGFLPEYPA
ncbi:MAG: ABC transporter ATP-binding protein/permease [Rickettsiales bacterium]|nr:ABC transporter ATP-binding protein/permease [Rickettsiales bacterium]